MGSHLHALCKGSGKTQNLISILVVFRIYEFYRVKSGQSNRNVLNKGSSNFILVMKWNFSIVFLVIVTYISEDVTWVTSKSYLTFFKQRYF